MDDPQDLILLMLLVVLCAVLLVAGELYLVTRPDPPQSLRSPRTSFTGS